MRTPRTALLAAVTVAALAGCDRPAAPHPDEPAPNPAVQHAAIRQYAIRVTAPITTFHNAWQDYNAQGCLSDASSNVCKRLPRTLKIAVVTMIAAIDGGMNPAGPAYLGPPPPQIVQLVARTREAARKVDEDLAGTRTPGWQTDARQLDSVLGGWDPYLGAG